MDAGVIISAAAAVVAAVSVLVGFRRLTLERQLADRADARDVLEKASRVLWRMKQEMRTQFTAFAPGLQSDDWPADFELRIELLEKHRDEAERELDVLCIRFPADGTVVVPYRAAWKAAISIISIYMITAGGGSNKPELKVVNEVNDDFDSARRAFHEAAQEVVGANLGDKKSRGGSLAEDL